MLLFPSNEKMFFKVKKGEPQKNRSLYRIQEEVPTVLQIKCTSSLLIMWLVSIENNLMPPHFYLQGTRVNVVGYTELLKFWIIFVAHRSP